MALDEIQYYPLDWTDGMRVSSKDFSATDRAWSDAIRDVRATLFQGLQYGLLPALRDSRDRSMYPKLELEKAKNLLVLKACRAITQGGYRIEITEDLQRRLQVPLGFPQVAIQKKEGFSVYITVDMFSLKGAGKMMADAPPRHEFATSFYELSLIYERDDIGLSGFNHLKLAEYEFVRGEYKPKEDFIPACMTINAHAKLQERFLKAGSNLKSIHDNGILLCRQYRLDSRPEVKDAIVWVEKIVLFIARAIWFYNDDLSRQSPFYTLTFFKNLGQFILSTSDIYQDNHFLKKGVESERPYFKTLADPNFNSADLRTAFTRIDDALTSLHLWFKSLSESFRQARPISVEEIRR